ncbi:MAG: DUF4007 family protein [candidate division WOR-3 bacterium]
MATQRASNFRIGNMFHETFRLSRPAIAEVLAAAAPKRTERESFFEVLRAKTRLGTNYCKAMPRYAQGAGLLKCTNSLTELGEVVLAKDPALGLAATQWLLHYYLSAPQGPGPLFWHFLVTQMLWPGRTLDTGAVAEAIGDFLRNVGQKEPKERALRSTATVFLGTYAKSDGLGGLGLIEEIRKGEYRVLSPSPPPLWVLAFTLADSWSYHWPDQLTVNLSELGTPGGWASLFLMDGGTLGQQLQKLKEKGVLDIYRVAPPYQVVRLWKEEEKGEFLARAYA